MRLNRVLTPFEIQSRKVVTAALARGWALWPVPEGENGRERKPPREHARVDASACLAFRKRHRYDAAGRCLYCGAANPRNGEYDPKPLTPRT